MSPSNVEHTGGQSNASDAFYEIALNCTDRADAEPSDPLMPMACIVFTVTALEAFVNEEVESAKRTAIGFSTVAEALRDGEWNLSARWLAFLRLICPRTFDTKRDPYQSFEHLIRLRDALVGRTLGLRSGRLVSPRTGPREVITAADARWACHTAEAMIREHYSLLGESIPAHRAWKEVRGEKRGAVIYAHKFQ